jgi:hypothetical protein
MPKVPESMPPKTLPRRSEAAQAEARRRDERLAAALKANLARRKRQSRARADGRAEEAPAKPEG